MTNAKQIELEAEKILETHSVRSIPVPIEEIAQKENIFIGVAEAKDISGVLLRKEGVAFIALNSKEPSVRQRFTLAHELGHYFLHQNKNTFIEYRDNKEQENGKQKIIRGPKEIEANKFAAALLMPKKFLVRDVSELAPTGVTEAHVTFLANKYGVSEKAMTYRLMNLSTL
jgi:Zn-dependent peptidase ImmA (M78 family)